MHRANRFIEIEEEKAIITKRQSKASILKEKPRDEYYEPRQHYDCDYAKDDKGKKSSTYVINRSETQPSEAWNKYYQDIDETFCEFHKRSGHTTDDCRQLQFLLLSKFKKGDHNIEYDDPNIRNDERREYNIYPAEHTYDQTESLKRTYESPPRDKHAPRRQINMIIGGLTSNGGCLTSPNF